MNSNNKQFQASNAQYQSFQSDQEEEEELKQENDEGIQNSEISQIQNQNDAKSCISNVSRVKNSFISFPVIAILSIPSGFQSYPKEEYSYIYTSYVQYFQQSGLRIIPLNWTDSLENLENLMNKVNGLVLTGGGANLMMRVQEGEEKKFTQFSKVAIFLIELAKKKNEKGNYFPLWTTCLGFELLFLSFSNQEIRNQFDSKNHFAKQIFSKEAKTQSRILSKLSKSLIKCLEEEEFFYYNHKHGFSKKQFLENPKINQNFNCIAYSKDQKGKQFVSIAEGKVYPFYGTQFHPEKLQFDQSSKNNKQFTINQLRIAQHIPNFFYTECLKSNQRFDSAQEQQSLLIENHQPVYKGGLDQGIYLFKNVQQIQNEINSNKQETNTK
ncbi:class I glutamine amidotransferase (macronuclear) [Tetrahymena thermophila SB210]|uniref:folate gamma-glutamyl hydrolase n=1 Tax=Tetrahymena thermophila (strain SB210) TaxID=312017 RepID=Q22AT8_TETTS|nr:class I glutamine amidotransferase [Tetrahymena thermophila SB210]EAR82410.1 class I glutamine amidotransferase [Tetrahymena thermophila SB210]|eukprot:XP_001030073.1 class I glutamine amidotransferase [Tetrahymena thermophila SB210]